MAEVSQHPRTLDYRTAHRPPRQDWEGGQWLEVVLDAVLVLVAAFAVAALVAIVRVILLLATSSGALFGVHW